MTAITRRTRSAAIVALAVGGMTAGTAAGWSGTTTAAAVADAAQAIQGIRTTPGLEALPMVSLGSPAHPKDPGLLANAGSDKYIEAYITPSRLFDSIVSILPELTPRARSEPESSPSFAGTAPSGESGKEHRILLVEDNIVNQKVALGFLKRMGLNADVAVDGQQALEVFTRERPDLVMLDVVMPRLTGLETCRILKAKAGGNYLPVIMVSTRNSVNARVEGLRSGADDYLGKPYDAEELCARVEALLRTRKVIAERAESESASAGPSHDDAAPSEPAPTSSAPSRSNP